MDYTINTEKFYDIKLNYKVIVSKIPQFKKSNKKLFSKLNNINVDSEKLLEYNYHMMRVSVLCTICNNVYNKRLDHYLYNYNEPQCPECSNHPKRGSEKFKEKVSLQTKKRMLDVNVVNKQAEGEARRERRKANKDEIYFKNLLEKHNIKYIWQKPYIFKNNKHCIFDFYLVDYDLYINIDGSFHDNWNDCIIGDMITNNLSKDENIKLIRIKSVLLNDNFNIFDYLKGGDANETV